MKPFPEERIGTVPACVRAKFRFLKMNNLVFEPQEEPGFRRMRLFARAQQKKC